MTKQRIALISVVALAVFALLLGGQTLYKRNYSDAAVLKQVLQIPGVTGAEVIKHNGSDLLVVETTRVSNLRQMVQELDQVEGTLPILIRDERNSELEEVYDEMQFAIQEGIVRGNFTEMAESVEEQAAQAGVEAQLAMDGQRIYLTLNQEEAQLVAVIERYAQGAYLPTEGR